MSSYVWPNDDGWPYPDGSTHELADLDGNVDDDALLLRTTPPRLFEQLEPLERQVITAHYGLNGTPARSMKQLHTDLGIPRADLREALAGGLAKLRTQLG